MVSDSLQSVAMPKTTHTAIRADPLSLEWWAKSKIIQQNIFIIINIIVIIIIIIIIIIIFIIIIIIIIIVIWKVLS